MLGGIPRLLKPGLLGESDINKAGAETHAPRHLQFYPIIGSLFDLGQRSPALADETINKPDLFLTLPA
jgi:hypothetical protein